MKKHLFFIFMILCTSITLGIYTNVQSMSLTNQNLLAKNQIEFYTINTLSKTKENPVQYTYNISTNTNENINTIENTNIIENTKNNATLKEDNKNTSNIVESTQSGTNKIESTNTSSSSSQDTTKDVKVSTQTQNTQTSSNIKSSQDKNNTTYSPKYSFFNISESISSENIKIAENEINKLPKSIINAFYETNWTLSITNENISNKYFNGRYSNVSGLTIINSKQIIIQNKVNSIQSAIIHEYGHYLDWYFDFPSENKEFLQIYNEEVSKFKSRIPNSSCVSDEYEFFAHTFYYSIKDSSKCTPKALEYVQRYTKKLS